MNFDEENKEMIFFFRIKRSKKTSSGLRGFECEHPDATGAKPG